ncbi:MAG: hypothetical protein RMK18_01935 [Armatimonadota bacterium]|nr:hypothetical protein [Armatimonadota bacterium]MCX7776821.1 hypothetical protein [Armatimonadota bacterium]MDW8024616.1 hypothetical protein [Armatimonadota bacterium]
MDGLSRERFAIHVSQDGEINFFAMQLDPTSVQLLLERTVKKKALWRFFGDLLPVGVKVPIPTGESVDVLALDALRNCVGVLFDLQPSKPLTLTIGRTVVVASWLDGLSYFDVLRIARDWWADASADVALVHAQVFGAVSGQQADHREEHTTTGFNEHPRVMILTSSREGLSELHRYLLRQGIYVEVAQVEVFTDVTGRAIICVERVSMVSSPSRPVTQPRGEVMGMVHSFLSALVERGE